MGIPDIVGIMDGCHIPIKLLRKIQSADYYCRKGYYFINVQAIIDHNMLFRDTYKSVEKQPFCNESST